MKMLTSVFFAYFYHKEEKYIAELQFFTISLFVLLCFFFFFNRHLSLITHDLRRILFFLNSLSTVITENMKVSMVPCIKKTVILIRIQYLFSS